MGGETVTVRMCRGERGTPWGFGVSEAPNRAVIIVNVQPGSLADRAGLRNGDVLDLLEGLGNLDINATDSLLISSRDKIELVVHRNAGASSSSSTGQARIWRPEITHDTQINKFQHSTHNIPTTNTSSNSSGVRVSLEHNNDTVPPRGFNNSALPFNTDPRVKHMQYNSPLNIYSAQAAQEQYEQQTQELGTKFGPGARQANQGGSNYARSETMRLIQEEQGRNSLRNHENPNGLPVCFVCTRPILGVMARAGGHDVHGDCLACATCGSSLKNIGHHLIDDKFYCDVHGQQRKGLGAKLGAATKISNVINQQDNSTRSFYQPEVMTRGPVSQSPAPVGGYHPPGATSSYSTNSHSLTTQWGNPRTQGVISPANRGVPTNPSFGANSPPHHAPPPVPATAPPATANTGGGYTRTFTESRSEQRSGGGFGDGRGTGTTTLTTADGKIPYCEGCNQQIKGAFVLAGGKSWCPDHFVCSNKTCGRRLLECGFVEENGQKFCEGCFERHIAPRCAKCGTAIVSDCLNALQKKWHPACFTCAHCQTPFGNSAFYLEQGLPYCEKDWNHLFTTKCVSCRFPIEAGDRWVEALGSSYHSNCFSCTRCHVNLEGESFYAKNGQPYCKQHA